MIDTSTGVMLTLRSSKSASEAEYPLRVTVAFPLAVSATLQLKVIITVLPELVYPVSPYEVNRMVDSVQSAAAAFRVSFSPSATFAELATYSSPSGISRSNCMFARFVTAPIETVKDTTSPGEGVLCSVVTAMFMLPAASTVVGSSEISMKHVSSMDTILFFTIHTSKKFLPYLPKGLCTTHMGIEAANISCVDSIICAGHIAA